MPLQNDDNICVTGFLHQTENRDWVLCDQPNIKSCCLKKHQPLKLNGDFSKYQTTRAITLKGSMHNQILNVIDIEQKTTSAPITTIIVISALIILALLIRKKIRS